MTQLLLLLLLFSPSQTSCYDMLLLLLLLLSQSRTSRHDTVTTIDTAQA